MLTLKHLQLPNKRVRGIHHQEWKLSHPAYLFPKTPQMKKKVPSLTFFGELLISSALEVPISLH